MATTRKPAAKQVANNTIEVILDTQDIKGKSIKFLTSQDGVAFNNLYVQKTALAKIGNPSKLKVTIEPAE